MDQIIDIVVSEQFKRVWVEYWPYLLTGIVFIAKWIRRSTLHWSLWPPVARLLGLLVEVLDVVHIPKLKPSRSDIMKAEVKAHREPDPKKRRRITARIANAKDRASASEYDSDDETGRISTAEVLLICLMGVVLVSIWTLLPGCAGTSKTAADALATGHEAGVILRTHTAPLIDQECSNRVAHCLAEGRGEATCPEYDECEGWRNSFANALRSYQSSLKLMDDAIIELSGSGIIK